MRDVELAVANLGARPPEPHLPAQVSGTVGDGAHVRRPRALQVAVALLDLGALEPELPDEVLGDMAHAAVDESSGGAHEVLRGGGRLVQPQRAEPERPVAWQLGQTGLRDPECFVQVVAPLLEAAGLVPDGAVPRRLLQKELEDAPRGRRLAGARLEQGALQQSAPRLGDWHARELAQQRARLLQLAHALEVLDRLEHQRLLIRAVDEPLGQDALAAPKVAALLLHLGVLEPGLRRPRLQLRREPIEASRLAKVLLALGKIGHLQVNAPVHCVGQLGHASAREILRVRHALALGLLGAQPMRECLVDGARLGAHRQLLTGA